MLFKMKHEGPHEDRNHIMNALYHTLTRNLHLGCSPPQFPKSPRGSPIRWKDLGTNHPSRPTDDLCVQLPPAMGVKWREPHRGHKPTGDEASHPPSCQQDMPSPREEHTIDTNFCSQ